MILLTEFHAHYMSHNQVHFNGYIYECVFVCIR